MKRNVSGCCCGLSKTSICLDWIRSTETLDLSEPKRWFVHKAGKSLVPEAMEKSPLIRRQVDCVPHDERFRIKTRQYVQQYSQIYFARLQALRPVVKAAARQKWSELPDDAFSEKVMGLPTGKEGVVVGILFRPMVLKPSILKEYGKAGGDLIPAAPKRDSRSYLGDGTCDQDRTVLVEDESGRTKLDLTNCTDRERILGSMVTGFIIAIRGMPAKGGTLAVSSICTAGPPTFADPLPEIPQNTFICIVSGISVADPGTNPLAVELLLEYLNGNIGGPDHEAFCVNIVRLIVAGNSIGRPHGIGTDPENVQAIRALDRFMTAVGSAMHVDLLPGELDPTNVMLPQQPLNRCLLPSSSRYDTVRRATNPYDASIGGRRVLGTSGQNVTDYTKYDVLDGSPGEGGKRAVGVLEIMLENRHLAPTAPDTLRSYPSYDTDSFVIDDCPDIFFAGNQEEYAEKKVQCHGRAVSLISVPDFAATGKAVLVNLRDLSCSVLEFAVGP